MLDHKMHFHTDYEQYWIKILFPQICCDTVCFNNSWIKINVDVIQIILANVNSQVNK